MNNIDSKRIFRSKGSMRLANWSYNYLKTNGNKNTRQILDFINKSTRDGSNMPILSNVLDKDNRIVVIGQEFIAGTFAGRYKITVWGIKEGF